MSSPCLKLINYKLKIYCLSVIKTVRIIPVSPEKIVSSEGEINWTKKYKNGEKWYIVA